MYVAIKKFKESDDNEYVKGSLSRLRLGEENGAQGDQDLEAAQAGPHSQPH